MVFMLGCKDTTDDNINTLIPSGEIPDDVEAVELIFPFENSLCTEGTNVTSTTSTVYDIVYESSFINFYLLGSFCYLFF